MSRAPAVGEAARLIEYLCRDDTHLRDETQMPAHLAESPLTCVADRSDLLSIGRFLDHRSHQQIAVTVYDSEQVVKIMSDAASKLADRIHFLTLKKFRFQVLSLS